MRCRLLAQLTARNYFFAALRDARWLKIGKFRSSAVRATLAGRKSIQEQLT